MSLRKVLVTVVGHVDHGKTSLLDKIRRTAVATGEAGGITQAIGVSIIPIETVKKICGPLMSVFKQVTVPGLVTIDTPGHAAFTSLRRRGGSLADIAIIVVDINEGFMPQTIESIEILKANKVPFIVAVNKIDLLHGWKFDPAKSLLENLAALDYQLQGQFEGKMYELVAQFQKQGLSAERFDRVEDYTQQIALVPVSAFTGQGIPELLMVLTGLAQRYLEQQLVIEEHAPAEGTILEVKEEQGLGMTINAIIYNGHLSVNDTLVIGGIEKPLVAKVRALLEPAELAEMREKKSRFKNVKEVFAATGVKIAAPGLDTAIAGMPFRSCSGKPDEIAQLGQQIQTEVGDAIAFAGRDEGVIIKADTIGGLEALQHLLAEKKIPISSSSLGDVTKKDLSTVESMKQKNEFYGVLLGFNVTIPDEITAYATAKGMKLITREVIYKIIEDYENHISALKKEIELRELNQLVRPCKFRIMKGYVFRQNNPAIVGVEIEIGKIRSGDPLMNAEGKRLTIVKSMKEGEDNVTIADQGKQLALAMDNITIGRQVQEGDFLYTDLPENDFKKMKELKKYLSKSELDVLREIMEIKRKENPVWGVG